MKLKHLLISLACLLLLAAPAAAAGGDGTSANPYQIETAAELQSIQNDLSAHYILMNDIDLTGTWSPIGSSSTPFFGSFDGNGKTISNLTLSTSTQSTGFFGSLTSGATIKDLTFADCSVTSTSERCGVLAGSIIMSSSAHETAIISNVDCVYCSASTSSDGVANLVGMCGGSSSVSVENCEVINCIAESTSYGVANLVGLCNGGSSVSVENCEVINCIAESTLSSNVANLVGMCGGSSSVSVENCEVINCIAKGINYVGGIFGRSVEIGSNIAVSNSDVVDCTFLATTNYAGGIAGRVTSGTTGLFSGCTVSGCTILASSYAAGICPAYS